MHTRVETRVIGKSPGQFAGGTAGYSGSEHAANISATRAPGFRVPVKHDKVLGSLEPALKVTCVLSHTWKRVIHASLTTSSFNPSCLPCATLVCKSVHDIHKPHRVFVRFVLFCFVSAEQSIHPGLLVYQGVHPPVHPRVEGGQGARQGAKEKGREEIGIASCGQVSGSGSTF